MNCVLFTHIRNNRVKEKVSVLSSKHATSEITDGPDEDSKTDLDINVGSWAREKRY